MILCDRDIRERRGLVTPIRDGALQPCSVDVHVSDEIKVWTGVAMSPRFSDDFRWKSLEPNDTLSITYGTRTWVLHPGKFYLAALEERITVPGDLCGFLTGVSTRAREGIVVHQQAGLLDPGYSGHPTCEITVQCLNTHVLARQRIGQVYFVQLTRTPEKLYNGRYQGDTEATPARYVSNV